MSNCVHVSVRCGGGGEGREREADGQSYTCEKKMKAELVTYKTSEG